MTDACVIGYGTVGKATALSFNINKYYSRSEGNITLEEASKFKYIFICLPTPTIDGVTFTKDIEQIIKEILSYPRRMDSVFIIRSTVPVGFAQSLMSKFDIDNIISNPEFLSDDTWEKDAVNPDLIVLGASNSKYLTAVKGLYKGRFRFAPIIATDNPTAELIKLTLNSFFALKVVFGNEIFDFAQKKGANYETVKSVLETHPWGSKNHFTVWHKNGRGAGGKCLRKDFEAFAGQTKSDLLLTAAGININLILKTNK